MVVERMGYSLLGSSFDSELTKPNTRSILGEKEQAVRPTKVNKKKISSIAVKGKDYENL